MVQGAGLGQNAATGFQNAFALAYISQDVATVAGQSYTFSFYYASDGFTPNEFVAQRGDSTVSHVTNDPRHDLTLHSFRVVATGAKTTITFGGPDDVGALYLDVVSVTQDVGAEPVPAPEGIVSGLLAVLLGGPALRRSRG